MRDVIAILHDEFETLDVFGPIEILGRLPPYFNPRFYSAESIALPVSLMFSY